MGQSLAEFLGERGIVMLGITLPNGETVPVENVEVLGIEPLSEEEAKKWRINQGSEAPSLTH